MSYLQKSRISPSLIACATAAAGFLAVRTAVRLSRRFDFAGKSVLVTGGSRGLGLVMARELAQRGARLTICARNEQELALAEDDLRRRGAQVLAVQSDMTS